MIARHANQVMSFFIGVRFLKLTVGWYAEYEQMLNFSALPQFNHFHVLNFLLVKCKTNQCAHVMKPVVPGCAWIDKQQIALFVAQDLENVAVATDQYVRRLFLEYLLDP